MSMARQLCQHNSTQQNLGDVRVLKAVNKKELQHMVDVIVFSSKGLRPVTDQMSGSDLDGDVYSVTWDSDLKPKQVHEPMDYTAPGSPPLSCNKNQILDAIKDYIIDFLVNDQLGLIDHSCKM